MMLEEISGCATTQRLFKLQIDAAMDWGQERRIPVCLERDRHGFWFVKARLEDSNGIFWAAVSVGQKAGIAESLDTAVWQARTERRHAFAKKRPGHLPAGREVT